MTTTAAHPRFAEALHDLGLDQLNSRVRRFPEATRAAADVVRETTGYAIGGVPPFGHRTRTRVPADRDLLAHAVVGAAAGNPHVVFPMAPQDLVRHADATLVDVREHTA
ncbi:MULTISPECIES: YbaK/EbsC family protein [unclassified Streptomyces]|uniref:YbaK/EbsC family protein n=1 Tax=unclassified Streptomyces TaxID=2593676 RepID=UPI0037FB1554